jgi:hypothetical protein
MSNDLLKVEYPFVSLIVIHKYVLYTSVTKV